MFRITSDQPQNRLTIGYSGHVNSNETQQCEEEIRVALATIKPGFRLLVDLTDLQSMDVTCAPHIRNIMEACNQKEVAKVVRIIPDPKRDIGLQIMSHFHYGEHVHIVTCANLEEAVNFLAI